MQKIYKKLKQKTDSHQPTSIIEKPMLTSFLVLLVLAVIVLTLSYHYYEEDNYNFVGQVLAEAHGMLFDIAVIGILLVWLRNNGEKRQQIRKYKDEIDDFRLWESEEAAFRTVGNIKRLNGHKITDINLVNCHLSKTNLSYVVLKGSNINSANVSNANMIHCNLENTRLNQTNFENSNLNQAEMSYAMANGANFKDCYMIKVNLQQAFLIKANLTNAFLMEADMQGAHLTGTNLENTNLFKADLRGAIGLTVEQLSQAKTLYMAKLDPELMEKVKENETCLSLMSR
jgi:BTB/POZ domain-containing protein KCTD9